MLCVCAASVCVCTLCVSFMCALCGFVCVCVCVHCAWGGGFVCVCFVRVCVCGGLVCFVTCPRESLARAHLPVCAFSVLAVCFECVAMGALCVRDGVLCGDRGAGQMPASLVAHITTLGARPRACESQEPTSCFSFSLSSSFFFVACARACVNSASGATLEAAGQFDGAARCLFLNARSCGSTRFPPLVDQLEGLNMHAAVFRVFRVLVLGVAFVNFSCLDVAAADDADSDGVADSSDSCPYDELDDIDSDSLCGSIDSCPHDSSNDIDSDGLCGNVDSCPSDGSNDGDGDNLCDDTEWCASREIASVGSANSVTWQDPGSWKSDVVPSAAHAASLSCASNLSVSAGNETVGMLNIRAGAELVISGCASLRIVATFEDENCSSAASSLSNSLGLGWDVEEDTDAFGVNVLRVACAFGYFDAVSNSTEGQTVACDAAPDDVLLLCSECVDDVDNDGICTSFDSCPLDDMNDLDSDSLCGDVDSCPADAENDVDGDGLCDFTEWCPELVIASVPSTEQAFWDDAESWNSDIVPSIGHTATVSCANLSVASSNVSVGQVVITSTGSLSIDSCSVLKILKQHTEENCSAAAVELANASAATYLFAPDVDEFGVAVLRATCGAGLFAATNKTYDTIPCTSSVDDVDLSCFMCPEDFWSSGGVTPCNRCPTGSSTLQMGASWFDECICASGKVLGDANDTCACEAGDDSDSDGICTAADSCPSDFDNDADSDSICDGMEWCPELVISSVSTSEMAQWADPESWNADIVPSTGHTAYVTCSQNLTVTNYQAAVGQIVVTRTGALKIDACSSVHVSGIVAQNCSNNSYALMRELGAGWNITVEQDSFGVEFLWARCRPGYTAQDIFVRSEAASCTATVDELSLNCSACPFGTYFNASSWGCESCPEGAYTVTDASTSFPECICASGKLLHNASDTCACDDGDDVDSDGICTISDICEHDPNNDLDSDSLCGDVDSCPADAENDVDGDGLCDFTEWCPELVIASVPSTEQVFWDDAESWNSDIVPSIGHTATVSCTNNLTVSSTKSSVGQLVIKSTGSLVIDACSTLRVTGIAPQNCTESFTALMSELGQGWNISVVSDVFGVEYLHAMCLPGYVASEPTVRAQDVACTASVGDLDLNCTACPSDTYFNFSSWQCSACPEGAYHNKSASTWFGDCECRSGALLEFPNSTCSQCSLGDDEDSDSICTADDSCEHDPNNDLDSDSLCGDVDSCPADAENDVDGDGLCDFTEWCPELVIASVPSTEQAFWDDAESWNSDIVPSIGHTATVSCANLSVASSNVSVGQVVITSTGSLSIDSCSVLKILKQHTEENCSAAAVELANASAATYLFAPDVDEFGVAVLRATCGAGLFAATNKTYDTIPCTSSVDDVDLSCFMCPEDFWSSGGVTPCNRCPTGSSTLQMGASWFDECICASGKVLGDANDTCACEAGDDSDSDGICTAADSCPNAIDNDVDSDGLCADVDSCATDFFNDGDSDGICNSVDSCPSDPDEDFDEDGVCTLVDSCPLDASNDGDSDLICSDEDSCPLGATNDMDADGLCDDFEWCPEFVITNVPTPNVAYWDDPVSWNSAIVPSIGHTASISCTNNLTLANSATSVGQLVITPNGRLLIDSCSNMAVSGIVAQNCTNASLTLAWQLQDGWNISSHTDAFGVDFLQANCLPGYTAQDPSVRVQNLPCTASVDDVVLNCTACPVDTFFNSTTGQCDHCPDHSHTNKSASTWFGDCVCASGTELVTADSTCDCDTGTDLDSDGLCAAVDSCPLDASNDFDSDALCEQEDVCPFDFENDPDSDGICSGVDSCPFDAKNDMDADGICDSDEWCPAKVISNVPSSISTAWTNPATWNSDIVPSYAHTAVVSCHHNITLEEETTVAVGQIEVMSDGKLELGACSRLIIPNAIAHENCSNASAALMQLLEGWYIFPDVDDFGISVLRATCGPGHVPNHTIASLPNGTETLPCTASPWDFQLNCTACPADTFFDFETSSCRLCPAGSTTHGVLAATSVRQCYCQSGAVLQFRNSTCSCGEGNDVDSDSICTVFDSCPADGSNDVDSDNVCADFDSCPNDFVDDADSDGTCHSSDVCPFDSDDDIDSDFVCGNVDSCAADAQNDIDSDFVCGDLDSCAFDSGNDVDSDLLCADIDSCDLDPDNDGDSDSVCGDVDYCPNDPDQDLDSDGVCGDVDSCPTHAANDADDDGICEPVDSCPLDAGNDIDSDSICESVDSCPFSRDNDVDSDNICEAQDSCPFDPNNDVDSDMLCGNEDSCLMDSANDADSDDICDGVDSCLADAANDADSDDICDGVDSCLADAANDADSDDICDGVDSCLADAANDADSDDICDGVDSCLADAANDADSDDICDGVDSCLADAENDADSDDICDGVDSCLADAANDADSDDICDGVDSCLADAANDADSDDICDGVDSCLADAANDADSDDICDGVDSCLADAANDADSDDICDGVDSCLADAANDADSDDICDGVDSCLADAANDADSDDICDGVDSCLADAANDADSDDICDGVDSCLADAANDADSDDICDGVDSCLADAANDADSDDICDGVDSCLADVANDADSDDICDGVDSCLADAANDADSDDICDGVDSCLADAANDADSDDICDGVDSCLADAANDADSDDICDGVDSCLADAANDADSDDICDGVDSCLADAANDADSDDICDGVDSCLGDSLNDRDSDGICTTVDSCAIDNENDADGDRLCGNVDECKYDGENDVDSDDVCADLDSCPRDAANDFDSDVVCGNVDSCPFDPENDADDDLICAPDDICSYDPEHDSDSDNICGDVDSCPYDAGNDIDSDLMCRNVDSCHLDVENDADSDSVCALFDSCPYDTLNDIDSDAICGNTDSCPNDPENDIDSDVVCRDEDSCALDAENDADGDNSCSHDDACVYDAENDADSDLICGNIDSCMYDSENDGDSDLLCGNVDSCMYDAENDADSDTLCGDVDSCQYDVANDVDSDTVCANSDSCEFDTENDVDSDVICGNVDSCAYDAENDVDSDVVCANIDSCARDAENDADSDVVCGDVDSCMYDAENDADSDVVCGNVDSCSHDAENDADSDLVCGNVDSCMYDAENDADSDEVCGDADSCVYDAENDADSDLVCGDVDSCMYDVENDADSDLVCGDVDFCVYDAENDADSDSVCGDVDSCKYDAENDADSDTICADVSSCDYDAENDADSDMVCGNVDSCMYDAENDADSDVVCGDVDSCMYDAENDADSDVVCGDVDSCVYDTENDADSDVVCGNLESCMYDAENDADSDLMCGDVDSCNYDAENDVESDAVCGDVDSCMRDAENDADSDAICGDVDSCMYDAENDADSDSVCGNVDSCKYDAENDADSDTICADVSSCDYDAENDADSDMVCGNVDSCMYDAENDADSDVVCGDVDSCMYDAENDADSDVVCGDVDSCVYDAENDADSDLVCGDVDSCMYDAENDADSDMVCGNVDSCMYDAENDADSDVVCGDVDSCMYDAENDADSDVVCGDVDSCVYDTENDADSDVVCGNLESCMYDAENDADSDLMCGDVDSCNYDAENDVESDAVCGDVDSCMRDAENDADSDAICGDVDSCMYDAENDADSDSVCGNVDSCKYDAENDADSDTICADVSSCDYDAENDADSDMVCGNVDSCMYDAENDADSDVVCGDVDSCMYDAENDADSDVVCGDVDSCVYDAENDADSDLVCGDVDSCMYDAENDADSDVVCGDVDSCMYDAENDVDSDTICADLSSCDYDAENDADSDSICGNIDSCRYDAENDADSDMICGNVESCVYDAENDSDSDLLCGNVDSCMYDSENDADSDLLCGDVDSCRFDAENDRDGDSWCGDVDSCRYDDENDADSDTICGDMDSCAYDFSDDGDSDLLCGDVDSCEFDADNDIDSDWLCGDVDFDNVRMYVCTKYPCDPNEAYAGALPWDTPVIIVGQADQGTPTTTYAFALHSMNSGDVILEREAKISRFWTFTASELELVSSHSFKVSVTSVGPTATASIAHIRFAAPPLLLHANSTLLSSTYAVGTYLLTATATDRNESLPLRYSFDLVGYPTRAWGFQAAFLTGNQTTVAAPSTRSFQVLVTVSNRFGSSTTCVLQVASNENENASSSASDYTLCPVALPAVGDDIHDCNAQNILDEIVSAVANAPVGGHASHSVSSVMFMAGLDAVSGQMCDGQSDGMEEILFETFSDFIDSTSADWTGEAEDLQIAVSQDVMVLAEFVEYASGNGNLGRENPELLSIALGPIMDLGEVLLAGEADDETLQEYTEAVDEFAAVMNDPDDPSNLGALNSALLEVCATTEAGEVPDGAPTLFNQSAFTLVCTAVDTGLAIAANNNAVSLIHGPHSATATSSSLTVALTTWTLADVLKRVNASGSLNSTTRLMSEIQSVHLVDSNGADAPELESIDEAYTVGIAVNNAASASDGKTTNEAPFRRRVSCKYFDEDRKNWTNRGIVLRGIEVWRKSEEQRQGIQVAAMCILSHLSTIGLVDDTDLEQIVRNRFDKLGNRVAQLNNATREGKNEHIPPLVPVTFATITVVFVVVVVVSKVLRRKDAVAVARKVFVQRGRLAPPSAMGSREYEAILRRWLRGLAVPKVLLLEVVTNNPFLGFFFRWGHEAMVFSRSDRAINLYAAILITFMSSALFIDIGDDEEQEKTPLTQLVETLVVAGISNALMMPVEHLLPYMTTQVNSIDSSTPRPRSLIRVELDRLSHFLFRGRKERKRRANHHVQMMSLDAWMSLTAQGRLARGQFSDERKSPLSAPNHVSLAVHDLPVSKSLSDNVKAPHDSDQTDYVRNHLWFFTCSIPLPAIRANHHADRGHLVQAHKNVHVDTVDSVREFQKRVRQSQAWRVHAREVEFDEWYERSRCRRQVLASISTAVLCIIAASVLGVCLSFASVFDEETCVLWMIDVLQTVALQILVTAPLIGLGLIMLKLFISWLLLVASRHQRFLAEKRKLRRREAELLRLESAAATAVSVANATSEALALVATGDEEAIAVETKTQIGVKQKQEAHLSAVSASLALLYSRRQALLSDGHLRAPKKIKLELETEKKTLTADESETRMKLRAAEVCVV